MTISSFRGNCCGNCQYASGTERQYVAWCVWFLAKRENFSLGAPYSVGEIAQRSGDLGFPFRKNQVATAFLPGSRREGIAG